MTSVVLAGGKSSRFGSTKAHETIGDKRLIEWVVDRLAKISTEIIIVTSQEDCFTSLAANVPLSLRIIADIHLGKGPLGGVYTGLVALANSRAIVVGSDMPFLSIALLSYMIQHSQAFDAVIPRIGKWVEPLCAVYSKDCLAPIQRLLERNELRISKLFTMVKVKYVEEAEIDRFDPEHLSFFNINTKADLNKARRLTFQKGLANPKY
jgi:molybdopterin-guanine dinucleotide biosynthesis protein A